MHVTPLIREAAPGRPRAPHPRLAAAFDRLDRAGVRWCLLRGEHKLHAPTGDIDLLVASDDLDRVHAMAADLGLTHIPAWGYGSHVSYLAYDEPTGTWLKLDFVTDLAFGPGFSLATGVEAACLDRRRRRGSVAVLADEDAFWCLLLHVLLDKGKMRDEEAAELSRLAAPPCASSPLAAVVEEVAPARWSANEIVEAARAGHWDELFALGPALGSRWARRHPARVWRRRMANDAWRWAGRLMRLRRRPGVAVTLLGGERAAAAAALKRSFYFPVRVVDRGPAEQWALVRYHRARGRLVLLDAGRTRPAPDLVVDAARGQREITAAIWQAYRQRWDAAAARRP